MEAWRACPGCGLRLPAGDWEPAPGLNGSGECWQVNAEVVGFEVAHLELVRRFHQLTVDAYGAQHAGGASSALRVAYSLVGLHLALDHGMPGHEVRGVHQHMGRRDPSWPALHPPDEPGGVTILDVAEAGVMVGSVEGHAAETTRWAEAVWQSWHAQHAAVAALTDRVLSLRPRLRPPTAPGGPTS